VTTHASEIDQPSQLSPLPVLCIGSTPTQHTARRGAQKKLRPHLAKKDIRG
jgi:hypothetical protein